MTDKSLTQRGTVRKLQKPLAQLTADARIRAETRARNRRLTYELAQRALQEPSK